MSQSQRKAVPVAACLLAALAILCVVPAQAQVAKQSNDSLSALAFTHEKLRPSEPLEPINQLAGLVSQKRAGSWEAFKIGAPAEWQALVSKRTGTIAMAEGGGIAWIPGHGNKLTMADLPGSLKGARVLDLKGMESIARGYLPAVADLLGVDPANLRLNLGRSGQPASHVWFVDFDVLSAGEPIEGARAVFRVNNGNLIQFGTEGLPSAGAQAPRARLSRADALAAVESFIGGFTPADKLIDRGTLHLITVSDLNFKFADGFEFGRGRTLARVWDFTFHRDGVMGTWKARVDAASGEVLSFEDVNDYAQATGGIYPNSPTTTPEIVRPMPFLNLSSGGATNSAGLYTYPGGTVTATLTGTYVRIVDTCGAISLNANTTTGDLAFGTSAGTDCTTPGVGGVGNTHSARNQFYHVNRIKEVGRGWLPGNTWLTQQVRVNVNLNQTCNAYWLPSAGTLNFFKSGGGCANTGQLAAVSLHEFGHGLDQNDGTGTAPEGGTGEAYGDFTAALAVHTSCIGAGFLGSNCSGYGDACTACTGVRDIDWAKHSSNTPATVNGFTRVRCGAGSGPCGKEVHCESYVPSEAVWDLANRDLPSPGTGIAWTITDRLWYLSRSTATSSFSCTTGATFTSNGCGTGSWWKTMRAVDDDDGNLSNGTPHSGALFAAFNRHGIACTTDAGASTSFSGCTPPAAPSVSYTPGNNSVAISVSGTGVYDIFRNEVGCNAGFTKIANDNGGSLTDTGVANGSPYFYQVVAHPSGNEACGSAPTTCTSVTPVAAACTPPASAPTGVTATGGTNSATVSWSAVSGATEYHVLRSTTSGGPYTQVGSVTGTSFGDSGLACNTTYFYVVRAANSATCETGNSAQASATTAACPSCTTTTLYSHNFDAATGLDGFTTGTFVTGGSTADWRGVQTCTAASGTRIFRFGGTSCTTDYGNGRFAFAQPNGAAGITIPAGSNTARLTFKHRRAFETGFDGGTLTISTDGTNYTFVPASAILAGTTSYNGTVAADCPPAGAAGASIFTTTVDLDAACNAIAGNTGGCAGKAVRIGFTTITDCGVTGDGWFLDDVAVSACTP